MKNKEVYIYRISTWFIGLIIFFLASCSQTSVAPIPPTEPSPAEDPIFSTLDFATSESDVGRGLAVNGNDLYVVGYTGGDLDGTHQGSRDGFLRRYNGGKLWGLQFGTRVHDEAKKVATDSDGNVYVVGTTRGPLGFQVGDWDTFLTKYSKDGELVWIRQFGTKGHDSGHDLAIDSNDRIYVLSDEGASNFVIRKFNLEGSLLSTKSVTSSSRPGLIPIAITVDNLNNLIVLTRWNNSGNSQALDVRLFKYRSNLSQVWQRNYGTASDDYPHDITTDSNNNIYFTLRSASAFRGGRFVKKNPNGNTLYERRLEYSDLNFDTSPKSITLDSDDNIYIAGNTGGSFSGFSNAGDDDIVVFKYNSSGSWEWTSQFDQDNYGSAKDDDALDIAVNDVIYITGSTKGNLLTGSATSYGGPDAYVAQLDKSDGTILGVDQ